MSQASVCSMKSNASAVCRVVPAIVFGWVCVSVLGAGGPPSVADAHWPSWRGPDATGVGPRCNPPVKWSETENIRWKIEIPGRGHATPIVWGDHVYVQTAVKTDKKVEPEVAGEPPAPARGGRRGGHWMGGATPTQIHEFMLLAIDRRTGKTVWQRTLRAELPHEGGHRDASQASNSPVTDGEHIIACFGSRGVYCLDMQGQVIWEKHLGKMETRMGFGEGSSPALHGNTVILNWDHEGQSFIVALDKLSGEQRWKVDRDEHTSWATPLVVEANGRPQVVVSATKLIRSYDLAGGELVWQCGGMTGNVVPTPVYGNGLLYAISGFRDSALLAIRYGDARGDIADSPAVAWKYAGKGTPYVPSPLLYGDTLYFLDGNRAVLSCVDASSGQAHYAKQRLDGPEGAYASLVGADQRVYVVGRNGTAAVIKRGPEFELLASNVLDDSFTASPALAGNEIYLRGHKYLYCIAKD